MDASARAALAGHALPGGSYRITSAENAAFCEAVGSAPDASGRAHPLFYYIATQAAMGLSVEKLLALCEFDVNDGPMMIGSDASFTRDLQVNVTYRVTGEIVAVTRKPSRAFGVADTLTFRLKLIDPREHECASATSSWILPRRNLA